ncbi:MAG TPA: beta-ketoacyl-[acyl-carrier-protein] synthase family protein [Planctomycetota bacterium]|nr:beta-ketoacyl-[acyl-carrier-protein] synthase family protein [Planctomycetota bacterium]
MDIPEVVITGMGCVTPHGKGVQALWRGLLEGRSALQPLTLFDASVFRNPLAGTVSGYPADPECKAPSRALRMLIDAADEAVQDALQVPQSEALSARISADEDWKHAALVTGTNFGGMSAAEVALVDGRTQPEKAGLEGYLFGAAGNTLAARYGFAGPRLNLSLSCASGTAAIGLACDMIRRGRADVALACGYDELSLYVYAGLSALRAITPETIRPFDKRRKGTLFSEGAGVVVLESAAHAAARGRTPYAKIAGRAMNNDAYHMTAPEQEARGIQALMRAALADAGISPEQIDHLNLHATGTPYNDAIETKAAHAVFGGRGREIPVCSVKSSIGHCMGAAGTIESIAAVMSLREQKVPPVLGLDPEQKDPDCNLNTPTGVPLACEIRTLLKTSYGFGGTNAAVVLSRT